MLGTESLTVLRHIGGVRLGRGESSLAGAAKEVQGDLSALANAFVNDEIWG